MQIHPVEGIPYRFGLHTHSHIALLGWIYMGFTLLLAERYLPESRAAAFKCLFGFKQVCLLGMLFSFPVQGYAAVSITFSTLFVLGTYVFAWWVFRALGRNRTATACLLRWSLGFLALSSIGPYFLGYFMASGLGHLHWYNNAIYFYLHFLYNGFFFLALFALLLDLGGIQVRRVEATVLAAATALSFFLSVLWIQPPGIFYFLGGLGALAQFWVVIRWCIPLIPALGEVHGIYRWLLPGIVLKCGLQLLSAFPPVAAWAFQTQMFTIIGYIHWVMLVILTPLLFLLLFPNFPFRGVNLVWIGLYGIGCFWTEALLFGQGLWPGLAAALPLFPALFAGYGLVVLAAFGIAIPLVVYRE